MRTAAFLLAAITLSAALGTAQACEDHQAKASRISLDAPVAAANTSAAAAPDASAAADSSPAPAPSPTLSASAAEAAAADYQHHDLHHEKHLHQGH